MIEIKEKLASKISGILGIDESRVYVEKTDNLENGDLTTNIALQLSKELGRSPFDIAEEIVSKFESMDEIGGVEIAGPGFVNFYLSDSYLKNVLTDILENKENAFKLDTKSGKNLVIEYTDPNPFKILHIGHLYTNIVGESFARLQEALGANVKRANYQGDVGLHVAKSIWGLMELFRKDNINFDVFELKSLHEKVAYLGDAYIHGSNEYKEGNESAIEEIKKINYYIFSLCIPSLPRKEYFDEFESIGVQKIYEKGREWCLEFFEDVYRRTGTKFDHYFFESNMSEKGLNIVLNNTDSKGIGAFKSDDGAVIYQGDPQKGLHTRVFVNKEGLPTYEAKELALAFEKFEMIKYNESVIITGNEQKPYFQVVFDALSQFDPTAASRSKHFPHGLILGPDGKKMGSRKGGVMEAVWLLDETRSKVESLMKDVEKLSSVDSSEVSDTIAVAAIKYSFLKVAVGKDVTFDLNKSISFDGDTGPYLLYVYARSYSLLKGDDTFTAEGDLARNPEEKELVRVVSRFKSVLLASAVGYAPNILCSYLFDLGQSFNRFYQSVRILDSDRKEELLALVYATAQVMKYGLGKLGIKTVENM